MIISHKNGRGNKIHIYIDGEYRISTTSDFFADNYFKENSEIDEEELAVLEERINYSKAINKCYDLLSRRAHSVKELRDKLLKSFSSETCDKAISQMLEYGYLNDEEYAKDLLSHLIENKKMSRRFIFLEMNKRGISHETVESLLENVEIDNVQNAYDIISSKYINKLNEEGGKQKIIAAMSRKGFSYSDIVLALEKFECYDEF